MNSQSKKLRNCTGANIRKYRNSRDWSQRVLARELNLNGLHYFDTTLVGKIEAGIRRCYDYEVYIIANVLNVGLTDLYPSMSKIVDIAQDEHNNE